MLPSLFPSCSRAESQPLWNKEQVFSSFLPTRLMKQSTRSALWRKSVHCVTNPLSTSAAATLSCMRLGAVQISYLTLLVLPLGIGTGVDGGY